MSKLLKDQVDAMERHGIAYSLAECQEVIRLGQLERMDPYHRELFEWMAEELRHRRGRVRENQG